MTLRLLPHEAYMSESVAQCVARELGIDRRTITCVRTLKRSIDARQRTVYVNLSLRVYVGEEAEPLFTPIVYPNVEKGKRVIIVGAGPAGLFAALRCIELGLRPIVLERGKDVRERKKDVARISRNEVDEDSNYCFGEGGAGAYSDGKLYTRSKKRGSVEKILRVLCQHGASQDILSDAHPHVGTDRLPRVVENIRHTILTAGGEVHFQTKMTSLTLSGDECTGCEATNMYTGREENYRGPVILATGHSARDVYRYLASSHIEIESKALAMGVRLEHPSELIDQMQYHNKKGRGDYLPAAEYSFTTQMAGRGVYSFCMCPGGFVIPATTRKDLLVVNGMSAMARNSKWSNSGMVVEVKPEGDDDNPLEMMELQEQLEHLTWQQGNRSQVAPAQRMDDFVRGRLSYDLPKCSYSPGVLSSPLHFWLPRYIVEPLQGAFLRFGQQAHGFLTNEAVVIATETRTSSPIRVTRDNVGLHHIRIRGLYPCGEGAGYAGGIVSSAIDGERCAEAVSTSDTY